MARTKKQKIDQELDEVIAPNAAPCPTCPKCPHGSAKREPKKSKLSTVLISAAVATMGFAMLTGGGRSGRR